MSHKRIEVVCGFCSSPTIKTTNAVKAARKANRPCFCNWECLKEYNKINPNLNKAIERFWKKVSKSPGLDMGDCWEWVGSRTRGGYGGLTFCGKIKVATHVAYFLTTGYMPDASKGDVLCHVCDNPPCVNPDHLFLGDRTINIADMHAKGRHVKGSKIEAAKLTEDTALLVRALYATGKYSVPTIAQIFKIKPSTTRQVLHNRSWRHVPTVSLWGSNGVLHYLEMNPPTDTGAWYPEGSDTFTF